MLHSKNIVKFANEQDAFLVTDILISVCYLLEYSENLAILRCVYSNKFNKRLRLSVGWTYRKHGLRQIPQSMIREPALSFYTLYLKYRHYGELFII